MSATYDYGPLVTYEVIWNSGQVEHIQAHQVLAPKDEMFPGLFGGLDVATKTKPMWMFHGEINDHWMLLLAAPAEDIKSVRTVTYTRDLASGGPA